LLPANFQSNLSQSKNVLERKMQRSKLAINCEDESLLLTNEHSQAIWDAFQDLIEILLKESNFASPEVLFAWKQSKHLAQAKEPYAWRAALDEIKDSNLSAKCSEYRGLDEFVLMTDKPAMLKLGGEVANSLMHSYTSKHKITFGQSASKDPSLLAL
jgi:hypothetical protein